MKKLFKKKPFYLLALVAVAFLTTITGCKKKDSQTIAPPIVSPNGSIDNVINDLKKIRQLGFDPLSTEIVSDGYRVEGDIHLTKRNLNESVAALSHQQGQYSTRYALAAGRTINVALYDPSHTTKFSDAFNATLVDMKNLKLPLKFVKVNDTTQADVIVLFKDLGGADASGNVTLGQDGAFVDAQGNPGKHILLNSNPAAGYTTASNAFITSVLDHEFGHAIGLRHTDYKNRFYSTLQSGGYNTGAANQNILLTNLTKQVVDSQLGIGTWDAASAAQQQAWKNQVVSAAFGAVNEGDQVGNDAQAAHIYGTPLSPTYGSATVTDPLSIMLAVTGTYGNLTFSSYDNIALFGLYGNAAQTALVKSSLNETGSVIAPGKTLSQIVTAVKALSPPN